MQGVLISIHLATMININITTDSRKLDKNSFVWVGKEPLRL